MTHLFLMPRKYVFGLRHNIYTSTQPDSVEQALDSAVEVAPNPTSPPGYEDPTVATRDIAVDNSGFSVDPDANNSIGLNIIDPISGRGDPVTHIQVQLDADGFYKRAPLIGVFESSDFLRRFTYNLAAGSLTSVNASGVINRDSLYTSKEVVLYQKGVYQNFRTMRKLFIWRNDFHKTRTLFRGIYYYNRIGTWDRMLSQPVTRIPGKILQWRVEGGLPLFDSSFSKYHHASYGESMIL